MMRRGDSGSSGRDARWIDSLSCRLTAMRTLPRPIPTALSGGGYQDDYRASRRVEGRAGWRRPARVTTARPISPPTSRKARRGGQGIDAGGRRARAIAATFPSGDPETRLRDLEADRCGRRGDLVNAGWPFAPQGLQAFRSAPRSTESSRERALQTAGSGPTLAGRVGQTHPGRRIGVGVLYRSMIFRRRSPTWVHVRRPASGGSCARRRPLACPPCGDSYYDPVWPRAQNSTCRYTSTPVGARRFDPRIKYLRRTPTTTTLAWSPSTTSSACGCPPGPVAPDLERGPGSTPRLKLGSRAQRGLDSDVSAADGCWSMATTCAAPEAERGSLLTTEWVLEAQCFVGASSARGPRSACVTTSASHHDVRHRLPP